MNALKDFFAGLTFWWRGWLLILSSRRLLALALIPFLLSVAACVGIGYFLWTNMALWIRFLVMQWMAHPAYTGILLYPLLVLAFIALCFLIYYIFFVVESFLAIPFLALIAARVCARFGKTPQNMNGRRALRLFAVGLLKSVFFAAGGVLLFFCSFVPGLNLLATFGVLLLMAFDCMDYGFEVLGFGWRQRLRYLVREWPQWCGMALGLGLTLFLPGLTLLVIPGAVAGAARILKMKETL